MASVARRILAPLASLKLTVALFAMSTFLVFAGTLAQIDRGIWTVVSEYFRCYFAWIDLQIFFPRAWEVGGGFYFPGGWLIGGLLLANLLAAHTVRFTVKSDGARLAVGLLVITAGAGLTWMILTGFFTKEVAATEDDAFWRVLWRLAKGEVAALVLLAGCMLAFKQRAGIVLTHAGIILMLVSELITAGWAVEGQMRIEEGGYANYLYHTRSAELAIIDPAHPDHDEVVVVPASKLKKGERIRHDALPVDIVVEDYMTNCRVAGLARGGETIATAGHGLQMRAVERPEVSGAGGEQTVDYPAAYVTLKKKGSDETLGTYLVTPWLEFEAPQEATVGDKTYAVGLRFRRTYKPYNVHLIDFRHDKYIGTDKPKNYSSQVRLVDAERDVDREIKIWMNNPLRYRGETFYQSSFIGETITILQVVKNVGWMVPYVACMIVGTGLAAHFGINLLSFLRRRAAA